MTPVRQKLAIYAVLAIGSGAVVAAVVRLIYIAIMVRDADVTWAMGKIFVWTYLELNLAIMCNCALLLRPFVLRHMPWLLRRPTPKEKAQQPRRRTRASWSIGGRVLHGRRARSAIGQNRGSIEDLSSLDGQSSEGNANPTETVKVRGINKDQKNRREEDPDDIV
ncbi:hypothetical protein BGZ63DRAFT_428223 [Mariannaea sp. PMI_226]|nr:hypothetical protein BGZ63DRAFT_428223 [Mariannaea sp. PMI_226]